MLASTGDSSALSGLTVVMALNAPFLER